MSENSRTVEITEAEIASISNAMTAFVSLTKFRAKDMPPEQAAALSDQLAYVQAFLDKCEHAFKHNKPVRKASIYAIDGGMY